MKYFTINEEDSSIAFNSLEAVLLYNFEYKNTAMKLTDYLYDFLLDIKFYKLDRNVVNLCSYHEKMQVKDNLLLILEKMKK